MQVILDFNFFNYWILLRFHVLTTQSIKTYQKLTSRLKIPFKPFLSVQELHYATQSLDVYEWKTWNNYSAVQKTSSFIALLWCLPNGQFISFCEMLHSQLSLPCYPQLILHSQIFRENLLLLASNNKRPQFELTGHGVNTFVWNVLFIFKGRKEN